jgi:hypothetical protein
VNRRFFADQPPKDPQDTEDSYALISRVPGLYGNGRGLYLSGNRISSITGEVQSVYRSGLRAHVGLEDEEN